MYAAPPEADFANAEPLYEPDGTGEGYWVGAPSTHRYDGQTYLAVRHRDPDRRGNRVTIDEYDDGETNRVLEITAEELGVVSIERVAMATDPRTGAFQLYLPVDRGGNDWIIVKCADAPDPESVDPATARPILRPRPGESDAGVVKDPVLLTVGGRYYMFYSGAEGLSEQAHLATSVDGETWHRSDRNPVIERAYWHDHNTHVSAVVPAPDAPVWLVFYDGSGVGDEGRTWNLRTGMAVSTDLREFVDTCPDGPLYSSPAADRPTGLTTFGTCRYLDVLTHDGEWELFAEVAREDGSFDLRRTKVPVLAHVK